MNELTRTELIEMICPTSATYDCCQGNCPSNCDECKDLMNYLLDRYDKTIRADERQKCNEEFKQALKRVWLNGTVAYRIIDDVLAEYEKEQKEGEQE